MNFYEKNIFLTLVALLLFTNINCFADNVSVSFSGKIKASACEVIFGDGQVVLLGNVSKTTFNNAGDLSPLKTFSIILDCPDGGPNEANVIFNGTAATDTSLLAIEAIENSATGVAVRINEADGITKIKLGTPSTATSLVSGYNPLYFSAQYQALVGKSEISSGIANATAQFTVNYP